jgi:hypothetical protein
MALVIKCTGEKTTGTINPVDSFGNPAKVENPLWTASPATHADFKVAADGLSAEIQGRGQVGLCQINVKADVIVGEGVKDLVETGDLEFVAAEAVGLGITFGAVEPTTPHP